jgi:predicted transcriptional regulator
VLPFFTTCNPQQVLSTSKADFVTFGEKLEAAHRGMNVVAFASKQSLEEANDQLSKANKPTFEIIEVLKK